MEYVPSHDYDYVMNKYHDREKPFNRFQRFVRRDEMFAENTGLAPDEIYAGLEKLVEQTHSLPSPVRKARVLAYILDNTRISCDSRDIFPAFNMVDRPLLKTLVGKSKHKMFRELLPEVEARRVRLEREAAVTIWPDFDHTVPNFDRLFSLGFVGVLKESEEARRKRDCTPEQDAFFEGIKNTYESILAVTARLARLAEETKGSHRMASALRQLTVGAPRSFYEALMLDYLYFMISEHIDYMQVRSLSHFDRLFFPFYERDLQSGIEEESIRRDLAYFLLQFASIDNYWNQPVFLGGVKADGTPETNALSYLFLEVYDALGILTPKIQIKLSESTPKEFALKALDMIRRGHSSIVFVTDETVRRALVRAGVTEEDARLANIKGCYEYAPNEGFDTGMNYLNLLKPLEYALHEGKDGITGESLGRTAPALCAYADFDTLYAEYKRQLAALIDETVEVVNGFEDYLTVINPTSMLSATYASCLEKAKDAAAGGARYNSCHLNTGFLADIADSLTMLKKCVYDKKELTLSDFVAMLDRNYEGDEAFRQRLLLDPEKYGNNRETPDFFASDIAAFVVKCLEGKPSCQKRGARWTACFHVARMSYVQADRTLASPNGRRLGDELSKNCSASMGQNREGATAAILSITKIDATAFTSDCSLDLGLLPSAVQGEDGLLAMYGLLKTFAKRGGHAMHINVFDAETLRDAQAHPEKYADLQIRVCGWNVLWNNIEKKEQDGFIRQAESLC